MLTTLVLTRGYAGNLMSLLAVRHVRQPYQTLRDVLDDTSVIQIWQKNSAGEQLLRVCIFFLTGLSTISLVIKANYS